MKLRVVVLAHTEKRENRQFKPVSEAFVGLTPQPQPLPLSACALHVILGQGLAH
jgi:hypothetical protein